MIQIQDMDRYLRRLLPAVLPAPCRLSLSILGSGGNLNDCVVVTAYASRKLDGPRLAEVCLRRRPLDLGGPSFELSVNPLGAPRFTFRKWIVDDAELFRAMTAAEITLRSRGGRALIPDLRLLFQRLHKALELRARCYIYAGLFFLCGGASSLLFVYGLDFAPNSAAAVLPGAFGLCLGLAQLDALDATTTTDESELGL